MSTTINPATPSAHRIHRDGTSGDLVLTTPTYRPRLVGPTPVLPRRVDLAPRSSGLPAYSRATPRQGGGTYAPQPRPANVVPPARYDRMSAPLLQSTPEPPRRAGADDHYRYASRGF